VSPILTRPVREQLEHDRVIRLLQARYKRKTDVIINPGNEQNQSVTVGELVVFPDLLVFSEGSRRLLVTVEVETGESVNAIEARAEWGVYSKLKVPLHLYVPPACVDAVKRIAAEYQIIVSELWTYTMSFDQVRFNMVSRAPDAPVVRLPAAPPAVRPAQSRPEQTRGIKAAKPAPAKAVAAKPAAAPKARKPGPQKAQKAQKVKPKAKAAARPKAVARKPAAKAKSKPAAKKSAKKGRR
jgi:hypothetical protein